MTIDLARAYIGGLYELAKAGRITFEEVRRIEDEVMPPCERCGKHPQKAVDERTEQRICLFCDRIAHSTLLFH